LLKNAKQVIGATIITVLSTALTFWPAQAAVVTLVSNHAIVDNAPFYSIGPEDSATGVGNYALSHPTYIDIPYAIFDLGSTSSVSKALISWSFDSLYGPSGPAEISLYLGNDADGMIFASDRFMGDRVDTFTYLGGEIRNLDVTALVNKSLMSGQYFAARLEATAAPSTLSGYYGGNFFTPSLAITTVPVPAAAWLFSSGLVAIAGPARSKKTA
jgi:hypothetical protein